MTGRESLIKEYAWEKWHIAIDDPHLLRWLASHRDLDGFLDLMWKTR